MAQGHSSSRPSGLMRLIFKMPAFFYRIGLGSFLANNTILLTTTGRKSGQRRYTALNYARDGEIVYVLVGYGPRTDWYRNLLANPAIEVQIGRHRYAARARPVSAMEESARAARLVSQSQHGPPRSVRPILKTLIGFDYDAEASRLLDHPETILAVALELSPD